MVQSVKRVEAEQGGVGLAQPLVAGGGVAALVGLDVPVAGYSVLAVVLAGGDVDADQRDPGGQHPLGVGVHEVQIVVGVRQDLHQLGPAGAGDGHPRRGVGDGPGSGAGAGTEQAPRAVAPAATATAATTLRRRSPGMPRYLPGAYRSACAQRCRSLVELRPLPPQRAGRAPVCVP